MKIICRRCKSEKKATITEDIYKNTHHLECDWCEKCEKPGDDYWECFCCDKNNNEIDN